MVRFVRFLILFTIIGLLAASALTWKPLPQDGSQAAGDTPANHFADVMNRWAEKIPTLKEDILSLSIDLQSKVTDWKEAASDKTSFMSDIQWDQLIASEESTESFMLMLQQLKEQLKDVNMEDLTAKVQSLIGKAESLPDHSESTNTPKPEEN